MKYKDLPRYCPRCGKKMIFDGTDEYGTCFFICKTCHITLGD